MRTNHARNSTPAPSWAHVIGELASTWHAARDEHSATVKITEGTLIARDGVDAVGVLRFVGGRLASNAPTGQASAALDSLQAEPPQGPSWHVLHTHRPLLLTALAAETRWPSFTCRATQAGIASMLCLPLRADEHDLGTLNLYARTPRPFLEDAELYVALATHAAFALHAIAEREQLIRAVASRDRIGQAKGILMVRHNCTAQQAFDRLVAASQAANVKVVDVADWLLDEHGQDQDH